MAPRFNADIWINDTQPTIVAFGGKAPKPPDYGPIAAANMMVAQDQMEWAREQPIRFRKSYAPGCGYSGLW